MPRSEKELAEALVLSEAWMDAVDPDQVPDEAVDDRKDLRQIGMALIAIEAAEHALVSAVATARANKRSWTDIANVLGVSRQAARQRFSGRTSESDEATSVHLWIPSGSGQNFAALAILIRAQHMLERWRATGNPQYLDQLEEADLMKLIHQTRG